ncbi:MAG: 5'/3'-nucleotidase SurE [Kaiparowitsia implicata GSE-PSE-MK54-09C]|jgi:5'-nucleotidase|nr:5'/3'-nucleotidase SurE [Kaiparowitsia implicata GSE-PSE-MK54-09C]
MKLLISNDDGIFSQGVRTLANTLATAGHTITVVCPDRERSATGHGLTLHKPIRADQVKGVFDPSIEAWACSGTPSDCVKLALGALMPSPPDVVVSGINHGSNLGTDVLYSGTVSAAMEGTIEGLPGIALSLASFSYQEFQPAANFARSLLDRLKHQPLPSPTLLNINIPPVPEEAIAGVMITRQGLRRYFDMFEKRVDPRGKTYYWLAGEIMEDVPQPPLEFVGTSQNQLQADDLAWISTAETDVNAIRRNYITVTPLQYNLTCASGMITLKALNLNLD